jgi:hypothetical protein
LRVVLRCHESGFGGVWATLAGSNDVYLWNGKRVIDGIRTRDPEDHNLVL